MMRDGLRKKMIRVYLLLLMMVLWRLFVIEAKSRSNSGARWKEYRMAGWLPGWVDGCVGE